MSAPAKLAELRREVHDLSAAFADAIDLDGLGKARRLRTRLRKAQRAYVEAILATDPATLSAEEQRRCAAEVVAATSRRLVPYAAAEAWVAALRKARATL